MAKIVQLPGTDMSPAVVAHDIAEQSGDLSGLICISFDADGDITIDHSTLDMGELALAALTLTAHVQQMMTGGDEE